MAKWRQQDGPGANVKTPISFDFYLIDTPNLFMSRPLVPNYTTPATTITTRTYTYV